MDWFAQRSPDFFSITDQPRLYLQRRSPPDLNETTMDRLFLDYSTARLGEFRKRIDACLERLTDEQVWARGHANENAIANLILHLNGNVRQWILSGLGGQPDQRNRDAEFSSDEGPSKAELLKRLGSTVEEAIEVIRKVPAPMLTERRSIQGYEITVLEAIYQVVQHFSGHTAQIIFATKMLTGADLGFYRELKGSGMNPSAAAPAP